MSSAPVQAQPRQESETTSISLFDVLHNSLILCHVAPYLPIHSLLQLASTSKDVRSLVFNTPGVFRHLDLTQVQRSLLSITASDLGPEAWRNNQIDGNIPFEDFLSRPLRGVLNAVQQQNILKNVQTLVLDGLSVTSEICHEIINDASYNVRILSIREVKNLNHAKLRGALQYACRPTRPKESPRLKALYVFGPKDGHTDHTNGSISVSWNRRSRDALTSSTQLKGDPWWSERGQIVSRPISRDWVSCMASCEGIITFDAVLCRGPRHQNSPVFGQPLILADTAAAAATHAVAGCEGCGKAPEGLRRAGTCAAVTLPALAPVPIMSSSIHAATHPADSSQTFVPRCGDCLRERYCACCNKWWCESCYQLPGQGQDHGINGVIVIDEDDSVSTMAQMLHSSETTPKIKNRVSKSCWECGNNCETCISKTQRACKKCHAGYCIVHNEGSTSEYCDWCVSRGRGLGRHDSGTGRLKLNQGNVPACLTRRRMRDAVTRPLV